MFKYSLDNKRYHTLNYYLRNRFNSKVFKVPIDIGFSCPNKQSGGCIYCKDGSASNISSKKESIIDKFNEAKDIMEKKWPNSLYIAYFQSGTNTYGPVDKLKKYIDELLKLDKVIGISIATRPDMINDEWLDYLVKLNKKTFLSVEIGLQSSNDKTLELINRGHDLDCFKECVKKLKEKNIFICAHIINGLPYETKEDMLNTAKFLNDLHVDAIKIHALYISKDTKLYDLYKKEKFHILTKEEYVDIVCEQLELLDEKIVIERITGDPIKEDLVEPKYLLKKFCVLNDIDKCMVKRDIYQGDKVK